MEGRRAIAWLARHPSTATFIATKLVRHFVSDTPHPNDVDLIRQVFLDTGGDLAEVSRALVDLDDAFYGPSRKIRTPQQQLFRQASKTYLLSGFCWAVGVQVRPIPCRAVWAEPLH